jgi:hypothetical protein
MSTWAGFDADATPIVKPKMDCCYFRAYEEAVLKLGDLQRQTVSERTETPAPQTAVALPNGQTTPETDGANWEKLRELWNANGARLDVAIERIPDKRRRTKYSRMDRRNYPAIINGLADEKFISETARKGSLDLHATFVRHRPRSRAIPDQVIADMVVLDRMLEAEFNESLSLDTPVAEHRRGQAEVVDNHAGQPA